MRGKGALRSLSKIQNVMHLLLRSQGGAGTASSPLGRIPAAPPRALPRACQLPRGITVAFHREYVCLRAVADGVVPFDAALGDAGNNAADATGELAAPPQQQELVHPPSSPQLTGSLKNVWEGFLDALWHRGFFEAAEGTNSSPAARCVTVRRRLLLRWLLTTLLTTPTAMAHHDMA